MIDRAIIMLNDRRFWGHASGPSSSGKTLYQACGVKISLPTRILHTWRVHAASRSALPRERFSPMTQSSHQRPVILMSSPNGFRRCGQEAATGHDYSERFSIVQ
jgi:hypothetical protein